MIFNINTDKNYKNYLSKIDICIIGSGLSSASLVYGLRKSNLNILLIEQGNFKNNYSNKNLNTEIFRKNCDVDPLYNRAIGGNNNLWHGIIAEYDNLDFISRNYLDNSEWPISKKHIQKYYDKAKTFLIGSPKKLKSNYKYLLKSNSLINKVYAAKNKKIDTRDFILKLCNSSNNFHLIYNLRVNEIKKNKNKTDAEYLIGSNTLSDKKIKVYAKQFIICCNGIATPELLLNSESIIRSFTKNMRSFLGSCLMDHPKCSFGKVDLRGFKISDLYSDRHYKKFFLRQGFKLNPKKTNYKKIPNHTFFFRPAYSLDEFYFEDFKNNFYLLVNYLMTGRRSKLSGKLNFLNLTSLKNFPNIIKYMTYKRSKKFKYQYAELFVNLEQIPSKKNKVYISKKDRNEYNYHKCKINWKISKEDFDGYIEIFNKLKLELEKLKIPVIMKSKSQIWKSLLSSHAYHYLGTCRMSNNKNTGIVDKNLKIHTSSNIYICDGSVLTTGGSVNPVLTVSALALRLSDHLMQKK
tara:strand:+ start:353 stop:1912 length:1560 start_codon:yes stop_codon:yes gene_type:complete